MVWLSDSFLPQNNAEKQIKNRNIYLRVVLIQNDPALWYSLCVLDDTACQQEQCVGIDFVVVAVVALVGRFLKRT